MASEMRTKFARIEKGGRTFLVRKGAGVLEKGVCSFPGTADGGKLLVYPVILILRLSLVQWPF